MAPRRISDRKRTRGDGRAEDGRLHQQYHQRRPPSQPPKTLISIRFRCVAIADEFIDRLRSNPPAAMAKLHAAKKDGYEKKAKVRDKGTSHETFLCIGKERTLELPPGFEIIAMSRPDLPGLDAQVAGLQP
ncbi:hypothetical protein FB451DRAFT_1193008 [Mycena latifolia]|nr:hypothetical protein FB451DRAFT_1193008 [Mycena latifolia]